MSAEMPKMPEPVYIFWSADTLHIRLWTADPERAARFAADTGATATVYVPKQEVQEAARQAIERCAEVCDDQEEPAWYGYENPNTFDDGKRACASAIRALITQSEEGHGR